jgi:hypothetical protein
MFSILLWGLNKGFDITDEGYYLLGFNKFQNVSSGFYNFWNFIRIVFSDVELNVINVRIIRLLLTLFSSGVLSYGFYVWIKNIKEIEINFDVVIGVVLIGNFAGYTIFPQSLSYNSLISNYQYTTTGLLLCLFTVKKNITFFTLILFTGFLIPLQLMTKISSGFIMFGIFLIIFLFYDFKIQNIKRIVIIFIFFFGIILGGLLYFLFVQNADEYKNGITEILNFQVNDRHSITEQLKIFRTTIFELYEIIVSSVFWLVMFYLLKTKLFNKKLTIISYLILSIVILLITYYKMYDVGTTKIIFVFEMLAINFFIYDILTKKLNYSICKNEIIVFIFFFTFPFLAPTGTNNSIWYNSFFYISFWLLVIIWIYYLNKKKIKYQFVLVFSLIICVILFIYNYIYHPYRITKLSLQTEYVDDNKNLKGLRVDTNTLYMINSMKKILIENNFEKGDPMIILEGPPGIIYLSEGVYFCDVVFSTEGNFSKSNIEKYSNKMKKPIIIVPDGYNLAASSKYIEELRKNNINFPEEFKKIGSFADLEREKMYNVFK